MHLSSWSRRRRPGAAALMPTLALGVCSYDLRLKNTPTALQPTAAGTVTVRTALGGEALRKAFQLL